MLRQLSSSHDNGQSMEIYYIYKNMPRKLSSPHDTGQSKAMHPKDLNHASSHNNGRSMVIYLKGM